MSTFFPNNFSNINGLPMMETSSITVTDDNVVLTLTNRSFRFLRNQGLMLFRLNQAIPEGTTTTLPIVFSSNGFIQGLTNVGGTPITVAQVPGPGIYLIFYDKSANLMQLMTTQIPTTIARVSTNDTVGEE